MSGPKCGHISYSMRRKLRSLLGRFKGVIHEGQRLEGQINDVMEQARKWDLIDLKGIKASRNALLAANARIGEAMNDGRALLDTLSDEEAARLAIQRINIRKREVDEEIKKAQVVKRAVEREILLNKEADERKRLLEEYHSLHDAACMCPGEDEWPAGWENIRRWCQGSDVLRSYDTACCEAESQFRAGRLQEAITAAQKAGALRGDVITTAAGLREDDIQRRELAQSFIHALSDNHYDEPVYGMTECNNPGANFRIEASAPNESGYGNVSIEIEINGKVHLDIDHIPDGEEEYCRGVIKELQEAAESVGATFDMDDWGRAAAGGGDVAKQVCFIQRERVRRKSMY